MTSHRLTQIHTDVTLLCSYPTAIASSHQAQLLNYLKATGKKVGLLLNFGAKRVDVKRMVF